MDEHVRMNYPEERDVYIDDILNGKTNEILRVGTGTHIFSLGEPKDYAPGCGYKNEVPVWAKLATGDRLINAERAKRAAVRRSYYDPESLGRPRRNYVRLIVQYPGKLGMECGIQFCTEDVFNKEAS